jgi:hypothetical protein
VQSAELCGDLCANGGGAAGMCKVSLPPVQNLFGNEERLRWDLRRERLAQVPRVRDFPGNFEIQGPSALGGKPLYLSPAMHV